MTYKMRKTEIGDVKILKVELSTLSGNVLEKGDIVTIIGESERGWTVKEEESGIVIYECGWDIFE